MANGAAGNGQNGVWERIERQEHDFFGPQPIVGADVYLLRMIIHY
jgi:6-hydroxytryprostatin B O-methyltransferase